MRDFLCNGPRFRLVNILTKYTKKLSGYITVHYCTRPHFENFTRDHLVQIPLGIMWLPRENHTVALVISKTLKLPYDDQTDTNFIATLF